MDVHDLYPDLVLEEVKHPQNQGKLAQADCIATEGVASCGDLASVYLKIDNGKITKMTWEAVGCVISRAGLSLLSAVVINQPIKTVKLWQLRDMLKIMKLKQISPGREHCLLLGLRALQRALTQLANNK